MNRTRCYFLSLLCAAMAICAMTAHAQNAPPGPVPTGPPTAVEPIPSPTPPVPPAAPDPAPESKAEAPKPKRTRRIKTEELAEEFAADELLAATEYIIGKLEAETEANATNVRARNALYHLREALPHLRELAGT